MPFAVRGGQERWAPELVGPISTNFLRQMSVGHDVMSRSRVDDEVRTVELGLLHDSGSDQQLGSHGIMAEVDGEVRVEGVLVIDVGLRLGLVDDDVVDDFARVDDLHARHAERDVESNARWNLLVV